MQRQRLGLVCRVGEATGTVAINATPVFDSGHIEDTGAATLVWRGFRVRGRAIVIIVRRQNDYDVWLDPKLDDPNKLNYLFEPFPDSELIAYPVNPVVNNARHDAADCIESTA